MRDSDAERRGGDENAAGERERDSAIRDALANRRRRLALERLLRAGRTLTATTLARRIAVTETDVAPADLPVSLLQQTYLELTRVHIPALEAIDFLEHDPESGQVRLVAQPRTVRAHLDAVEAQITTPN